MRITLRAHTHRREEGNLSILGGNPLRALFCLFCTGQLDRAPVSCLPLLLLLLPQGQANFGLVLHCSGGGSGGGGQHLVCPSNGIAHSLAHCRLWRRYSLKSSSSALCTLCRFVHSSATARPRRLLSPFSQVASSFSSLLFASFIRIPFSRHVDMTSARV